MIATSLYLGPAHVIHTSGKPGFVKVALPEGEPIWARLALAIPYSPQPEDEVLVICHELPEAYVIGVLRGRGTTTLRVPGDLVLDAPHGAVSILAAKGIRMESEDSIGLVAPQGTFRFRRMNMFVSTLVQRLTNSFTWASGLIQFKGRRLRQVADEGWLVRAGRAHLKSTDNFHINGKTIHLG